MSVIDLIKREATYHGAAVYDLDKHRWEFSQIIESRKGVYIFIDSTNQDVLKVGKADGAKGLLQRLNEYRAESRRYLMNPSSSASVIKRAQETGPQSLEIDIYYIPITPIEIEVAGVKLSASPARELEHALHKMARDEGHSLRFAKNK